MSETKFTPAPWKIWGDWAIKDFTSAENLIATFENYNDAYLIVAAPELYGALDEVDAMLDCFIGESCYSKEMHEKIKATLAKARGELC